MEKAIRNCITNLSEEIEHEELNGTTWTSHYIMLCKYRKELKRTLRRLEKIRRIGCAEASWEL